MEKNQRKEKYKYTEVKINSIKGFMVFRNILSEIRQFFLFRGQFNAEWPLTSSLERFFDIYSAEIDTNFFMKSFVEEAVIIEDIRRKIKNYDVNFEIPQGDGKYAQWLSILQHYGGKTRFIDFSESFFVALFYAIYDENKDGAVWMINYIYKQYINLNKSNKFATQIFNEETYYGLFSKESNVFSKFFKRENVKKKMEKMEKEKIYGLIWLFDINLSRRMQNQQGHLICGLNFLNSFEGNLFNVPFQEVLEEKKNPKIVNINKYTAESIKEYTTILLESKVIKLIIPARLKSKLKDELALMNITYEILFPDFSGLIQYEYSKRYTDIKKHPFIQ